MPEKFSSPAFTWSLIGPAYWPLWMLIGLISVCALLPRRLMLSIGRVIGKLFYWKNAKRRRIADINIALCFPALDAIDRSEMVQRHLPGNLLKLGVERHFRCLCILSIPSNMH